MSSPGFELRSASLAVQRPMPPDHRLHKQLVKLHFNIQPVSVLNIAAQIGFNFPSKDSKRETSVHRVHNVLFLGCRT